MKNMRKNIITALAMILVAVISVSATLAYMTAESGTVTNTFTIGGIKITLDETKVDPATGEIGTNTARVASNDYPFAPGATYDKDPRVTNTGDDNAWVAVTLTFNKAQHDALKAALGATNVLGMFNIQSGWNYNATPVDNTVDDGNGNVTTYTTYTFMYTAAAVESGAHQILFTTVTIPAGLNIQNANGEKFEAWSSDKFVLDLNAYACQSDNVSVEDAADELKNVFGIDAKAS